MSKSLLSRRAFLQTTAGVAGASLIGGHALLEEPAFADGQAVAPSDRVRFGIARGSKRGQCRLPEAEIPELPGSRGYLYREAPKPR